jgi:hypothetical protein
LTSTEASEIAYGNFNDSFIHTNTMRSLELSKIQEVKSTPSKSPLGGGKIKPNGRMLILIHSNRSTQRGPGEIPEDSVEVTLLPPTTMDTPLATEYSPA